MSAAKQSAVALWTVAHSALYGYHIASLNGIQDAVVCDGGSASGSGYRFLRRCLNASDSQFGLAVTIFTLGGLFGSLSADAISRRYGRVGALRIAELGLALSAGAIALANSIWVVLAARIVVGLSSGLILVSIPPLLSHIAPDAYKTLFGTLHQSSVGIGMVVAQSLSLVLAKPGWWRLELGVATGWALLLLVVGAFVRNEVEDRQEVGEGEAGETTALLDEHGRKAHLSLRDLLKAEDSSLRYGFLVVCAAQFAQQACGISPVMYFSTRILKSVFGGDSKLVVLGIMAIGIPFNFLPGLLPKFFTSKRLLLSSATGTAFASLALAMGLNNHNQAVSGIAVVSFVVAFSIGLAPVAWVVLSEVVPPEGRTAVGSVAVGINWLTNFTAGTIFLPLQQRLSSGEGADQQGEGNIFLVFAGASVVACLGIFASYTLYERHRKSRP